MDAAALWQRVEGSVGLVAAVVAQLTDPEDLARVAAVSRVWREASRDERAWERMCAALPLLWRLKSAEGCGLGWRELFVQQQRCDYLAARPQRMAIGPRLELEHYRAVVGSGKLPPGCTQVTRAMIEANGQRLLERLDLEYEQSRLDKGWAIFTELELPPRPVEELAADLGRTKTIPKFPNAAQDSYAATLMTYWSAGDDSWFEAHISKHERAKTRFDVIDARGVREFFSDLLQRKESQIRKLREEMKEQRDNYWTESGDRKAYAATASFCKEVLARRKATVDAESTDTRVTVVQNNIRKVEVDEDDQLVRLVYDDLIRSSYHSLPRSLCIKELPTMSLRSNFLIGLEIYGADGDAIFSTLSDLKPMQCAEDNVLLEPSFEPYAWPVSCQEVP
eukprot:COSAG02_NODE_13225_length_1423_cov_1.303625_1_plen_392_part_10